MKLHLLLPVLLAWPISLRASDPEGPNERQAPIPAPTAPGKLQVVFAISPFLDTPRKDPVFREIVRFLLEGAPTGSSLAFFDGYNVKTIAEIQIPRLEAFSSPKTRTTQFRQPIQDLRKFLATDHPKPDSPKEVELTDALRLPEFLEFVGRNLSAPDQSTVVMALGSPLHVDVKEPGFSMIRGYFPSDGHLLADSSGSIYGLAGRSNALAGVTVHRAYLSDPWTNELHRDKISRFWTLFIQRQGGRVGTFTGDLPTAFAALKSSAALSSVPELALVLPPFDPSQTKIEMLRITRDTTTSDWISRDVVLHPAKAPPSTTVGPMKIGIRWKSDLDLDLYATPAPNRGRLYFENPRIPEGYYFKDHRSSPEREYEYIEFVEPVDVNQVTAAINFYEGKNPGGPEGEIRIEFEGRIYSERFAIPASKGNEGREGPSQGKFWYSIPIQKILGLTQPNPTTVR